ncbi:hypothetical protein MKX03_029017 [Papaver bracteatum]|nr:hypothetical protein MKX03_029017 [Papaver bracteatum]
MEDSFQPPVLDCAPGDAVHNDQQKPTEEGYASSISTDYSEEVSAASSSDVACDISSDVDVEAYPGKIDGRYVGIYACLNKDNSDDSSDRSGPTESSSEEEAIPRLITDMDITKRATAHICSTHFYSSNNPTNKRESAWVNAYGYYKKQTDCGGYAVILHNICNCEGSKIGKICKKCTCAILPFTSEQSFENLVPLIQKLQVKKLDCTNFASVTRKMNEAAHYLAKETKKKALLNKKLLVDKKRKTLVDYMENWEPKEFSDDLVSILFDDAFDTLYYNSDAMSRIAQSFSSCNS